MQPVVISNLLTPSEIALLEREIIGKAYTAVVQENNGRLFYNLPDLATSIIDRLTDLVAEKTGKRVQMTGRAFSVYSNLHGKPQLPPHRDKNDTKYILDYHLDSNIDWPVFVDDKEVLIYNNEAVIFSGKNSTHYRPKREFKDGEYVTMIFFHFIDLDDLETSREKTDEEQEKVNDLVRETHAFYFQDEKE